MFKSAQAIDKNNKTRFPGHESSLIHLLAKMFDSDSKIVNLKNLEHLTHIFLHFLSLFIVFNFFRYKIFYFVISDFIR